MPSLRRVAAMRFSRRQLVWWGVLAGLLACSRAPASPPVALQQGTVLIIGAGMAGLAAGQRLRAAGVAATLLEARERAGGRVWTDTALGVPIDMGAAWIHGTTGNPITELARRYGLRTVPTDDDAVALFAINGNELSEARYSRLDELASQFESDLFQLQEAADDQAAISSAVARLLRQYQLSPQDTRLLNWYIRSSIELYFAADQDELSLAWYDDDQAFEGSEDTFPDGYVGIVNGLLDGLDVRYGETVTSIAYSDTGVTVGTAAGSSYRAERAIITLPLGVLQAGTISFEPPLPPTRLRAQQRLAMGTLNKLALVFPRRFWDADWHMFSHLTNAPQQIVEWWIPQQASRPVLTGLVGGDYARALEQQPLEDIVATLLEPVRESFPRMPEPEAAAFTRWSSDPFARGSYSHIPPGATPAAYTALAQPVAGRLFFAGEATTTDYPGTVHGAYLSGERAADEVLAA